MSETEFSNKCQDFIKSLTLSPAEINGLQLQTTLQSEDPTNKWKEERCKRLTASNFGCVCKMKNKTHCANYVKKKLYSTFLGNENTKWGKETEKIAMKQWEKENNIKIQPSGLFVDEHLPFLAASPDGLIEKNGIIEIKCPATSKTISPFEGIIKNI